MSRPRHPPFTEGTAHRKVHPAEDAWNSRDPEKVARAYTPDSSWRNRSESLTGRADIIAFLTHKWASARDYRLIKDLWAFAGYRIAMRFAHEWRDEQGR